MTCVAVSGVNPRQILCLGISTQRSSFITWDRETGNPFHNFITWKDVRSDSLVQQWNKSLTMKVCFSEFCCKICCLAYVVCPKSKCTDFVFKCLLDSPEITSYLLQSMTLGKLHSGSNVFSTDHSSTGSNFP